MGYTKNKYSLFFLTQILLFLLTIVPLRAQKEGVNHQYWLDFYPHYFHNGLFEFYGNSGIYMQLGEVDYIRFQIKPSVGYLFLSLLNIHGGVALKFYSEADTINRFEFTPYEGLKVRWPAWQRLSFVHNLKVEERWSVGIQRKNDFDMRIRYKANINYKFFRTPRLRYWYMTAHFEYFYPLHNDIKELYSNKLRTGLGLGRNFSTLWKGTFVINLLRSRIQPGEQLEKSAITYQLKIYRYFWRKSGDN